MPLHAPSIAGRAANENHCPKITNIKVLSLNNESLEFFSCTTAFNSIVTAYRIEITRRVRHIGVHVEMERGH